jgi:hypothetical protein
LRFQKDKPYYKWEKIEGGELLNEWIFRPADDLCWIVGLENIFLKKSLRDTVRKISRQPDGRWLEGVFAAGTAPDGSLAVFTSELRSEKLSVNTYGPSGAPRVTIAIPDNWRFGPPAYDGEHVYILNEGDVFIFDAACKGIGRFSLRPETPSLEWAGPFLATKGKELWFVDRSDLTLHKFRIPKRPAGKRSNSKTEN